MEESYLQLFESGNYIRYVMQFKNPLFKSIKVEFWKSYLSGEQELIIDSRQVGGTFQKFTDLKLSYTELKFFINTHINCYGVLLK